MLYPELQSWLKAKSQPLLYQLRPKQPQNQTEVYAVHGADPEVLAYAMAKYSRSALSMKESLREISSQRAEHFFNTFYFQYGHRSIADLAHVAFAIERLSLLAAIILVDEQRWDGQERSTRYQNFRKSGWYLPDFSTSPASRTVFTEAIEALFAEYHSSTETMFAYLKGQTPRPAEMKEEAYNRTLKARAFDVSRYLLPLATNTSLGQIVNARTLETQISRLLSDPHAEVRQLGERLREAAAGSAWNVQGDAMSKLQREIAALDPALGADAEALLTRDVKIAPTLVKYAAPNDYVLATRSELAQAAAELMQECAHRDTQPVRSTWWTTSRSKSISPPPCSTAPAITPIARLRARLDRSTKRAATRSSRWARAIVAATTNCCASSPPGKACASTSSWTSAASATCTAIAAASRSCSRSPMFTATRFRKVWPTQGSCRNMTLP